MTTYAHASLPAGGGLRVPEWTFADRLRKIRTSGGWSQKEIAALLEVGSSAYAQWEAGNAKPRDVVSIANRLELMARVPAAWTLGLNAENRRPDDPNGGPAEVCTPRDLNPEPTVSSSAEIAEASKSSSVVRMIPRATPAITREADAEVIALHGRRVEGVEAR